MSVCDESSVEERMQPFAEGKLKRNRFNRFARALILPSRVSYTQRVEPPC
jgi:hypothetical protein